MILEFKYIIVHNGAVLFPVSVVHAHVAKGFDKVYSAGFCLYNTVNSDIKVFGESVSIDIKSHSQDAIFISDFFSTVQRTKYAGLTAAEYY